jgi:hypothetical protein
MLLTRSIVLLPKKYQVKINGQQINHGDYTHPLGCWGTIRGRKWRTPQLRKGLEGREAVPARDGTPAKPGFLRSKKCAQIILCKEKHYNTFGEKYHSPMMISRLGRKDYYPYELVEIEIFMLFIR